MKKIKRIIMILIVVVAFFTEINSIYGALDKYNTFVKGVEEDLGNFAIGSVNNHNVTEIATALGLIKQNPQAVQNFIDDISGKEYEELRKWLGIDQNGNVADKQGAEALYAIASILDTTNYYLINDCENGSDNFMNTLTQTNHKEGLILGNLQLSETNLGENKIDDSTTGKILSINQNTAAKEQLVDYFNMNISIDGPNWQESLENEYCGEGNLDFDKDKPVDGGINIATGDGEYATGNTVAEVYDDAANDIVDNSNASNRNPNAEQNYESTTGEKIPESAFDVNYRI